MSVASVRDALVGRVAVGEKVTVRGWVRTRRDSKAGISFVTLNDGSGQDSIQIVAPNTLANYDSEVVHLTAGCAVIATGTLVQSQGKGQSFEIQADAVEVTGMVDDPETYPIQPKPHTWSSCAKWRTCARAPTPSARWRACATASPRPSTASSTSAASSGSTRRS
jgi:asparaginyl-tRNA synthetase